MSSDINSLQFYLDHEEETRLEREKFLRGEDIDLAIIPKPIYNSWLRSKALGVNPYIMEIPWKKRQIIVRTPEEYQNVNLELYSGLENFYRIFGFKISIMDRNARSIADVDVIEGYYSREDIIGTTSSGIAYVEKRPVTCFGYQNYKAPFSQQFGITYPVLDQQDNLIGLVTILLPGPQPTQAQYGVAIGLLELMQFMFRQVYANQNNMAELLKLLGRALSAVSEGVIYLDDKGRINSINESALRILGARKSDDTESVLDKLEALYIQNGGERAKGVNKNNRQVEIVKHTDGNGAFFVLRAPKASSSELRIAGFGAAKYRFKDLLGEDRDFIQAKQEAFVVAPTDASVLIYGETGSGKELFAQAIHNGSLRRDGPFVSINCGAVPESLIESELFGYEPGAFTGASASGKIGVLEAASGGTLFLDEVESMPLHVQVRLLRALSFGCISRVGGIREIPVNIRVVSATKTDLLKASDEGNFREDLYYRLSTCLIFIPPLRERRGDISILARHFIENKGKKMGFSDIKATASFMESLYYYDWRGNVRELENVIERAIIFMNPEKKVLNRVLLYPKLLKNSDDNLLKAQQYVSEENKKKQVSVLKTGEEHTIQEYLIRSGGNITETAVHLGVSRQALYRKIRSSPILVNIVKEAKGQKRKEKKENKKKNTALLPGNR